MACRGAVKWTNLRREGPQVENSERMRGDGATFEQTRSSYRSTCLDAALNAAMHLLSLALYMLESQFLVKKKFALPLPDVLSQLLRFV